MRGGTQALGAASAPLAVGANADIISLDADDPSLAGRHGDALIDGFIFAGAKVESVWRRGEQLVASSRHKQRDAIAARYRLTLARLLT